jgi:hypothetical protein
MTKCVFFFIRSWLNSGSLKSIRYKIVNFDTKLLEGKVKQDPDQGESMKPVSSMSVFCWECIWLEYLDDSGYTVQVLP